VVVASPTFSQGLNLNAAVLLVPSLYRSGSSITGEEFANVAGRAGRAFVDVEGLVVHVIHDRARWRLDMWRELVASAKSRNLRSGLIKVVATIIERLAGEGVLGRDDAYEYLANSRGAWKSGEEEAGEEEEGEEGHEEDKREPLSQLVEKLDATVFGLIEALDADRADLPRLLDEALQGSLWARQIDRESSEIRKKHMAILEARAQLIWKHTTAAARKGHFAMGVGLEAGLELDGLAEKLAVLMDKADDAAFVGDGDELAAALVKLAAHLLVIRPFVPDKKNALPQDWKDLLKAWVTGVDANTIGTEKMGIVEDAFAYRLVWALEALRTRRVTQGWSSDSIAGGGAASLETGVPQLMMAMLVRSGLSSRRAAVTAVREGDALFVDGAGMRTWLESSEIARLTKLGDWPSPETAALWKRYREEVLSGETQKWRTQDSKRTLAVNGHGAAVPAGIYRVEIDEPQGDAWVCTPDYRRLVRLRTRVRDSKPSFFTARLVEDHSRAEIQRIGRDRAVWLEKEE
jgi:hypothetical protein